MEYLFVLILLLLSAAFLEWYFRIHLYHSWKERVVIGLFFFVVGLFWDYIALMRGHWIYPGTGLWGIRIGPVPLEDFLFVLILPYWILTVYKVLEKRLHKKSEN